MTTLSTFITMMDQFLVELQETFPEETKIKVYYNSFELMKSNNPRKVLDTFMTKVSPYASMITSKDEKLFASGVDILGDLDISKLWNSGISENTKNAIWAHLNTLYLFGTTLNVIPDNLMSSIEHLAQQYASQIDPDQVNNIDPSALLAGVQGMLNNGPK
jgi:hypothetical protein